MSNSKSNMSEKAISQNNHSKDDASSKSQMQGGCNKSSYLRFCCWLALALLTLILISVLYLSYESYMQKQLSSTGQQLSEAKFESLLQKQQVANDLLRVEILRHLQNREKVIWGQDSAKILRDSTDYNNLKTLAKLKSNLAGGTIEESMLDLIYLDQNSNPTLIAAQNNLANLLKINSLSTLPDQQLLAEIIKLPIIPRSELTIAAKEERAQSSDAPSKPRGFWDIIRSIFSYESIMQKIKSWIKVTDSEARKDIKPEGMMMASDEESKGMEVTSTSVQSGEIAADVNDYISPAKGLCNKCKKQMVAIFLEQQQYAKAALALKELDTIDALKDKIIEMLYTKHAAMEYLLIMEKASMGEEMKMPRPDQTSVKT